MRPANKSTTWSRTGASRRRRKVDREPQDHIEWATRADGVEWLYVSASGVVLHHQGGYESEAVTLVPILRYLDSLHIPHAVLHRSHWMVSV